MASLVRTGFARFINNGPLNAGVLQISVRNIAGKTGRVTPPTVRPAPFPYKTKRYTMFHSIFDKTTRRFDENSKLIIVEGPVAAGKSKFAQELADELEMLYYPEANLDMIYTNEYGYDLKQLDDQLPESCKSYDINNFLLNPKHSLAASFQIKQYGVKYSQYIDALAHILNTGQGVVLDRCCFSDFIFTEAMYSQGYLSKGARSAYYEIRKNSIHELIKPHLIIYLDVPANKVIENVKRRNISYEVNSSVLTPEYLAVMEKHYKQEYLKEMSQTTELLVYDWSNEGEVEVVVEDIERMVFENKDEQNPKFMDWRPFNEEEWAMLRIKYGTDKEFLMSYLDVPRYDVPELVVEAMESKLFLEVWYSAPGNVYAPGYNRDLGDGLNLFKYDLPVRSTLPLLERRIRG